MKEVRDYPEPELERTARKFALPAAWFFVISLVLIVPGIVLIALGSTWVWMLGIVLVLIGVMPLVVASGLAGSGLVSHHASQHRPFA